MKVSRFRSMVGVLFTLSLGMCFSVSVSAAAVGADPPGFVSLETKTIHAQPASANTIHLGAVGTNRGIAIIADPELGERLCSGHSGLILIIDKAMVNGINADRQGTIRHGTSHKTAAATYLKIIGLGSGAGSVSA